MGIRIGPSCHLKANVSLSETEQELRVQLEESKEKFYKLKEHFLLSEATVYAMANELQKHSCQKFKGIIESVLGEKPQYLEGRLAEKLRLAKNLREYSFQIQDQDQTLSAFQQKLQQGRDASYLLCQHLKDHLTWNDLNNKQGHRFHELLAECCRLAEDLGRILSPENHEDEDNKKEHELLALRMKLKGANMEKVKQILQHSLPGHPKSSSHDCSLCNAQDPPWTTGNLKDNHELSFLPEETYTQDAENKDKEEESVVPRDLREKGDKNNVLQDKMEENLAVSRCQDLCDSHQPGKSPASPPEERVAPSNLNMAKNQDNGDNEKEQESLALRLSTEGMDEKKIAELLPDSLGEDPETSSHHYDLIDNHEPCCTVTVLLDAHEVSSFLDAAQNAQECKIESPLLKVSRKYFVIIQDHAKKLTQLCEQVGKGRDASLSLGHHLEFLLTHDDPEGYQGQGYIQQLAQGCKMAENLVLKLSEGNNEWGNNEKEEKELLSKMDAQDGDLNFLIGVQAQDLTKLWQKLEEGRDTASMLHQNLNSLLAANDQHRCQMQSLRYKLAEGCKLAKCLAHKLSPGNLDDEDEDDQMTLDSSLCGEEENEVLSDSLDDGSFHPSCHPDVADPQKSASSTVFPSQKHEDCSALDGSTTIKEACAQRLSNGQLSSHFSDLQASQVWVESCLQGNLCLGTQLCQYFDYGDCKSRLNLSSTTWSTAVCTNSGNQCQPFQELNLDACLEMKTPPKLEGDVFESSAAIAHGLPIYGVCDTDSALKQKIIKRKLWLRKWKIACRFPSLQLTFNTSHGMKNPSKLEGDAFEGSAAITHGFQNHGLCDAHSVLKQKIIKRKLQLCKWKMACRFPGLPA